MFSRNSSRLDPRISAIADHLHAIEQELGGIGRGAGRRASATASAAGGQIADAIGPILNDLVERFRRSQRVAVDEASNYGDEAMKFGARVGTDAMSRISTQAKDHPFLTVAVALGVGVLIGFAGRRT
jgi:ElaB/YqjD/DUF883 family membrane-anchored ribosome-binding protein